MRNKQLSNFDDDEIQSEAKLVLDRAIYEPSSVIKKQIASKTYRNEIKGAGLSPDVTFNKSGNKATLLNWNAVNSIP